MRPAPPHALPCAAPRATVRGFTLYETIIVIGLLTLTSLGLIAMQPQIFKTQTAGRDLYVGVEPMQACAERLLAVRRQSGYGFVNNTLCANIPVSSGFNAPTVALFDAAGNPLSPACSAASSATCRAVISIARTAAPATALPNLTLQLSSY